MTKYDREKHKGYIPTTHTTKDTQNKHIRETSKLISREIQNKKRTRDTAQLTSKLGQRKANPKGTQKTTQGLIPTHLKGRTENCTRADPTLY